MVASTEEGAVTMGEALADMGVAWYDLSDEVAFWGQAYQTNIGDIIARQQEMAAATEQAFATMNDIVSRYGQAMADAQAGWMNQVEQNALQHQIGIVEAEINYQRSRAEAIAKAQADISALTAAGLVERAGEVQKKLDEELAMLDYNYETQKAWAEWHWQIQQLMQEHAHQQRLAEQAQYFAKELDLWFAQSKAKILALETETQAVAQWQKTSLNLASLTAKGVVAGAQLQVDALANLGASYDALRKGAEADLSAAQAEMDRLMGEIEALIAAGPQLPDVPDYSQWARDYSGSVASAGSAVKESATATLADVTTDIADAFVTAMEVFEQVAKYKPPAGLAAAMEALRMDIEAAVKQLYIAYEAIGKEGVEGAGLIADSAVKVLQAIGQAAETFARVKDYTSPMRGALDSVLDDVRYVLIKVREELLDLWGWAGERKDTVWGHMMSWADAVKGVVEVVGEAATAFAEVNKYQGIMPGIVDVLVADIKEVVSKLTSAIGGGDGVSEAQVQWMKLGAELIGLVVGVIDDLEKLAGLEAPARASGNQIALLINALNDTTSTILRWIPDVSGYWTDAQRATDELKVAWLEFEAKLLSTVVGVIDDLEKLAGLEAPVRVSGDIIQSVMGALRTTAQLIRENIGEVSAGFDLAGQPLDALKAAWLEFEAGLVSTLAGVVDDIQKLAGLEGPISVSGEIIQSVMGALRTTAQLIRENIGEVSAGFDLAGQPLDALKAAWLEFEAGLVSTLAGVVDDVEKIAAFEGELQISEDAISNLVNQLEDVANAILTHLDISGKFDEAGNFVDELKIKWAEIATGLVSMFAGAAADLASLADYAPDQAALASGITLFFTNLQQFLVEFDRQAGLFSAAVSEQGAATAKLIGDTVGGLGQAIQPLLDVAQFAVSPDQATTSVTLFFGSLETFLTIFAERAANFQSKASDETAKLAQAIGDTVGGIGNAVEPLINILEYNPEVKDIEKKFEEFFYHLERALFWIEWQKDKWVVSDAAIVLLERVDEVMGYLKTAVDFLDEMATYGQDATTPALVGFLAFLIDLEQIVGVINAARDRIQQEALDSAEEFASGCSTMLGHITDGINTLNSLPTMELDFYQGGYGVGVGFIQGMIDGLVNNASTLYATVAAIVAAAIAAAEAAAGAASPSKQMWNLGENMVDGLVGALRAGQSDVARVMAGLIASPTGVPSFAPAGAGARRWEGRGGAAGGGTTITEVHYHLHEGEVSPERMASLRQQFESMQMLERLRR
jgi:hypothetical protein